MTADERGVLSRSHSPSSRCGEAATLFTGTAGRAREGYALRGPHRHGGLPWRSVQDRHPSSRFISINPAISLVACPSHCPSTPQMETPYDTFAKGLIEGALSVGSTVSIERSVTLPTLYSDAVVDPFDDSTALASRGMLGRIGRAPCVIEPHAKWPSVSRVDQCLARASMLRAEQNCLRILWVISTGRPRSVITAWGLRESPSWGPGVYLSGITRAPRVIVLRELPRTPDTLLLRLMGRGRVL
ncbi:MAG: hypothetical protein Q8Q09_18870 [Deltaproteobacteria bacterium]|nr:hypothetical protein [Deltaproteobacteria bacterium]